MVAIQMIYKGPRLVLVPIYDDFEARGLDGVTRIAVIN